MNVPKETLQAIRSGQVVDIENTHLQCTAWHRDSVIPAALVLCSSEFMAEHVLKPLPEIIGQLVESLTGKVRFNLELETRQVIQMRFVFDGPLCQLIDRVRMPLQLAESANLPDKHSASSQHKSLNLQHGFSNHVHEIWMEKVPVFDLFQDGSFAMKK